MSDYNNDFMIIRDEKYRERYHIYITTGMLWWKKRMWVAKVRYYSVAIKVFDKKKIYLPY